MVYKTHGCLRRFPLSAGQIQKNQNSNIKHEETNIMDTNNDNAFNKHSSLLDNDSRYIKATLKAKLIVSLGAPFIWPCATSKQKA